MTGQRIPPVSPPYEPETAAWLARWMPPGVAVDPLVLFRTLAVHPELASRMRGTGAAILAHGLLPARVREIVIHRTSALTGAEYEWGVHSATFGAQVGFTPEQLTSTVHGSSADPCWTTEEAAAFRATDELHAAGRLSDALFAELKVHFADDQILELAITAGWYHVIAFVIGTAALAPEPWAARFPTPA